jgi:hypothetical protein
MQRYRRGVGVWECGKEMVGVQAVKGGGGRGRKCCWLAVDGRRAMGDDGCEMRAAGRQAAGVGDHSSTHCSCHGEGALAQSGRHWSRDAAGKAPGCGRDWRRVIGCVSCISRGGMPLGCWRGNPIPRSYYAGLNYERISLVLVPAKPTTPVPPTRACRCCLGRHGKSKQERKTSAGWRCGLTGSPTDSSRLT